MRRQYEEYWREISFARKEKGPKAVTFSMLEESKSGGKNSSGRWRVYSKKG